MQNLFLLTASAWNLVCGTTTTFDVAPAGQTQSAETSVTLRIDLDAGRWCEGSCGITQRIVAISGNVLTLERHGPPGGQPTLFREVDLASNAYRSILRSGPITMSANGTCARARFSGFPEAAYAVQ